ncbi:tetratricopeptide repeat protein [candidate division KSB1 bacterium]|nr:tetratricopeptide repeat protein [candidate division KSB1 bacterium]
MGREREAVGQYEKIAELGAGTKEILQKLIAYYEQMQLYDKAISHYNNLIELNPSDANTYYRLGMIHLKVGDRNSAKRAFIKATLVDNMQWDAYMALGQIYEQEGNLNEALGAYQKAESINPTEEIQKNIKRVKEVIKTTSRINFTLEEASQLIYKSDINALEEVYRELEGLQNTYPEKTTIANTLRKVMGRLYELWLFRGDELKRNPKDLQLAINAYEKSVLYAQTQIERAKALKFRSEAAIALGIKIRAETILDHAEEELKRNNPREARENLVAFLKIDPSWQTTREPRVLEKLIHLKCFLGERTISSES